MVRASIPGDENSIADLDGRAVGAEDETYVNDDFVRVAFFDFCLDGGEGGFRQEVGRDANGIG